MSKYIADMSVPISQPLGEAAALSTSIGVDVDAGGTNGATVGSVFMVGSWTAGLASAHRIVGQLGCLMLGGQLSIAQLLRWGCGVPPQ